MAIATVQKTSRLKLVLVEANTPGQVPYVNSNQKLLELMVGTIDVQDKDLTAPPTLVNDEVYIVASSPTGAWAGHAKDLAFAINSAWVFVAPWTGLRVWVEDEKRGYMFDGTNWIATSKYAYLLSWATKAASFTADPTEASAYELDSTGGNITVAFPPAATIPNVTWEFKHATGSNTVTFDPDSAETIDGAATKTLAAGAAARVSCTGSKFLVLA